MSTKSHIHCGKSELDYGQPKMTQSDIEHDYTSVLTPKNTIIPGNPMVFHIESGSDFVDLSETVLRVRLRMVDSAGGEVTATTKAAPVNNILHSLFSQVSVSMKETNISHPNPNYAYRAYLENLLNFSGASKGSWMANCGYFQDEEGMFDDPKNPALAKRRDFFVGGKVAEFSARLHTDINFQQLLVPSNLDVKFTLTPARSEFCIQSHEATKQFKIVIDSAKLIVRKVKLFTTKQLAFEKQIFKDPVRLPISQIKVQTISIPAGMTSFTANSAFTGLLPSKIIMGLVDNAAYTGTFQSNPFNFKNFDLSGVQLRVNGRSIPTQPIEPNFTDGHVIPAYETLYKVVGRHMDDWDNGISPELYMNGCSLYGFCTTSDTRCPSDDGPIHGVLDIELKFRKALPKTVTLVLYSESPSQVIIDHYRNVVVDY